MADNPIQKFEEQAARREAERLMYWFDLPKALATKLQVQRIGFVELLASEEKMAASRATDQISLAFELVRESLRRIDNKQLSTADGSADAFWAAATPGMAQFRALAVQAYNAIHNASQEDLKSFLGSRSAQVG